MAAKCAEFDDPWQELACNFVTYTFGETNACVKVVAAQSLKLGFQTNLDGIVVPVSQDKIGEEIRYLLVFDITKDPFGDRVLEISGQQSPVPCKLNLGELLKKQTYYCHLSLSQCFMPLFGEGLKLFSAGLYQ
ncbi:hypothetical protein FACS189413_19410 [Bacteroidia bacterium]|nr:hypothetical protein FACS189413_19410 [Bacteroidia bacterium]